MLLCFVYETRGIYTILSVNSYMSVSLLLYLVIDNVESENADGVDALLAAS